MTAPAHRGIGIPCFVPVLLFAAGAAWAQIRSGGVPRFEDYPVGEVFAGRLAVPKLITPLEHSYADQIMGGVDSGYGVLRGGREQSGANFAGDMVVIQWGCGSPCIRMAMVDARSGEVHYPPISFSGIGARSFDLPLLTVGDSVPQNPEVQFRPNSRLMIVRATPGGPGPNRSYTYYFLWRGNRWTLVRKVRWHSN